MRTAGSMPAATWWPVTSDHDGTNGYSGAAGNSALDSLQQVTSVTLTEQGTYGGGSFNLSNYEYQGQWNTVETLSQSNDWGDGYTGTNQGAAYNGGGDSGDGWQETQQSSGSLTEQGTYSGGGFSLTVSYQGSGQETFSGSASGSDSWGGSGDGGGDGGESPGRGLDGGGDGGSGGSGSAPYMGTDSFIASESAVGSYTVSAAGNYDGGSFSLGNYNFQGSSQGTYQQQEGDAETLYGRPSTYVAYGEYHRAGERGTDGSDGVGGLSGRFVWVHGHGERPGDGCGVSGGISGNRSVVGAA